MPKTNGSPPIQTRYLNPVNPDVRLHYEGYKQNNGVLPWEPLTPEQLEAFELCFLAQLPMFQCGRTYRYPFFLNINHNNEVNCAYREFFTLARPPSDANRDEFERQFAAKKVGESYDADTKRDTVPAPAVSGAMQLSLY